MITLSLLFGLSLIPASSEGDGIAFLLLAGPVAAITFYGFIYRYYRNYDKRFEIERSTEVSSRVLQASDIFMNSVKGSTSSKIPSSNHEDPTSRVGGYEREAPPKTS